MKRQRGLPSHLAIAIAIAGNVKPQDMDKDKARDKAGQNQVRAAIVAACCVRGV